MQRSPYSVYKSVEIGVNRKVVGNVENYLNMKFQTKIFTRSRENAKKLIFWPKYSYKKNLGFFGKNRALSLFYPYNGLTSCAKAKKSLKQFLRKSANRQTDCSMAPWPLSQRQSD